MDQGWKRTLLVCYFLFMVGFLFIYGVEFFETLPEKVEEPEVEVTNSQLIEEADYNYILNNKEYNTVFDYEKYQKGTSAIECFYEDENSQGIKDAIQEIIDYYKSYLEAGYYYYYGYPSTMDFVEFFNSAIINMDYYQVESMDDIYAYYSYIYGYNNYFNKVINIDDFDDTLVKEYYSKIVDEYLNMEGYHLLICKKNGASIVQYSEYTDEEKIKAQELYDKIYAITILITDDTEKGISKKDFFDRMADLFANGNFASPSIELNEYLQLNSTTASNFQEYYELGLSIYSEDLEISSGNMVSDFEKGCREIFSYQYDRLVNEITIEEEFIHDAAIITAYGYHLYINTKSSIDDLFNEGKLITVTNKVHYVLFADEYSNYGEEDYITPAGYLAGYLKAKDESNEEEKQEWINKILDYIKQFNLKEFDSITAENCESEFIDKYLKSYTNYEELLKTEPFNYDGLDHDLGIYVSNYNFFNTIYNTYSSSNNFDYIRYSYMLEHIDEFNFGDKKDDVAAELRTKVASYKSELSLIIDKEYTYQYGLFERLDKEMYDELMAHYATLK